MAQAGSGGRGHTDAGVLPEEDGMDPVQRLRGDVERALPRPGAEVPGLQLLQHQGDEGRPGCGGGGGVLQSLTL